MIITINFLIILIITKKKVKSDLHFFLPFYKKLLNFSLSHHDIIMIEGDYYEYVQIQSVEVCPIS